MARLVLPEFEAGLEGAADESVRAFGVRLNSPPGFIRFKGLIVIDLGLADADAVVSCKKGGGDQEHGQKKNCGKDAGKRREAMTEGRALLGAKNHRDAPGTKELVGGLRGVQLSL